MRSFFVVLGKIFCSMVLLILALLIFHFTTSPKNRLLPKKASFTIIQQSAMHDAKTHILANFLDKDIKQPLHLDGTPLLDQNKIPLRFMPLGKKYFLTSAGEDKEFNTEDDIEISFYF